MSEHSGNERSGGVGILSADSAGAVLRPLAQIPRFSWIIAMALIWVGACNRDPQPRTWPAGTLVCVDEIPVTAEDLAQDVAAVMLVEPQWTERQHWRLAFNEIGLPRAMVRARASAAAREAARKQIDEEFARISADGPMGPPTESGTIGTEVYGYWKDVGLVAWGAGMSLEPGTWSGLLEVPGAFLRVRLISRTESPIPAATQVRLQKLEVVYAETGRGLAASETELSKHRLTIVDPDWNAIVPERTKYLMRAQAP